MSYATNVWTSAMLVQTMWAVAELGASLAPIDTGREHRPGAAA